MNETSVLFMTFVCFDDNLNMLNENYCFHQGILYAIFYEKCYIITEDLYFSSQMLACYHGTMVAAHDNLFLSHQM